MREERLTVPEERLSEELLPCLRDSVFHVTDRIGCEGIRGVASILTNRDGRFRDSYPVSRNDFGRECGWVNVFDLRGVTDDDLEEGLGKLYFLNPPYAANNPIYFFLDKAYYEDLKPWSVAPIGRRMPPLGAWCPGDVALDKVSMILDVTVVPRPDKSPYLMALDRIEPREKKKREDEKGG